MPPFARQPAALLLVTTRRFCPRSEIFMLSKMEIGFPLADQ